MEAAKQLKICRLCATNGPNFRAIYNGQNEKNEIGEKISKCLPILISSDDELPGHICPMCLRSLNTSYKLLMMVIETDGKLRQQLSQSRINKNQQDCEPSSRNATGEAEKNEPETCGFYEINFVDTGAFASNMGTVHQSLLVCNLCHNSFDNAAELRQHKQKTHDDIDNSGGEDCHDSAIVEIKDEGILVPQDSNTESSVSQKTIGETVSEKMDDIIEEDNVVSVDSAASNKSLPDAKALEDHQNTHFRKEPYSCVTCPKRFRTYAASWIHKQSHTEKREFICDLCQRSYKEKRFLKRHMLSHLPSKEWDFECEICKFKFQRSTSLKLHMRVHLADHPYKCDICGAAYRREFDMTRHRKRHLVTETDKKKKQLSQFGDEDKRIHKLKSDKASDDIAKSQPIVCSLCGMSFSQADTFSIHMETIHQSKWICILCKNSFATSDELVQHKRETHSDDIDDGNGKDCHEFGAIRMKEERRSISEDCEEPASLTDQQPSRELGGSHLVEDQDAGAFEVKKERTLVSEDSEEHALLADQQPSQNLRKRKLVKDHQNVQNFLLIPQSSKGEYSCETCHRIFKTLAARWGHQRIHGRIDNHDYTCDYCLKKFARRYNLLRHIMGHLGPPDGLFECKVCGSLFKDVSQLKNHMKVHTEERIHECDVCGIRFRRKHHMLRHRSCHGDEEINRKQQQQLPQSNDDDDQQNSKQKSHDSSDEAEKGESLMCGLSEISFVDVSTFDSPIETFHQSKWACNLCQNSFATSEELRQHQYKTHYDNIDAADGEEYKDFIALDDEKLESQQSESKPPTPKEKTLEKVPEKDGKVLEEGISSINCDICCFSIDKAFMPEHKKIHEPFEVVCSTCWTKFSTAYDFIKHNRETHHRFKNTCIRFFCRICNRSLSTPEALKEHHKVCEPRAPCKYYDRIFNKSELQQHMKNKHPDKILEIEEVVKLQCPRCKVVFTDKKLFMDHSHEPSEDVEPKASTCNGKFETSHAFSRHVQQEHKIRMTSNETAPQPRPKKIRKKRIIHPEQDSYTCNSCDKKFETRAAKLSHQRAHGIATQYTDHTCDYCQRNFRHKYALRRHIRCHMPKYQCETCFKRFHLRCNLITHQKRQMGLLCQQCSMEFADLCSLTAHLKKVHDMSIPVGGKYACKQCSKRFPKLRLLRDHQNIHSREEPYRCETCDQTFRTYAAKWWHEQKHKGEAYVCDYCQKSFKTKQILIRHMQLHLPSELWRYECKICQAKFKRPANLQDHMRSHSPNVNPPVYKCDICEAQYRHKDSMLKHRKRHLESA